jgi:hypothetical protein
LEAVKAGGEIVWNAELPLHCIEVSGFQDVGAKAGLPAAFD